LKGNLTMKNYLRLLIVCQSKVNREVIFNAVAEVVAPLILIHEVSEITRKVDMFPVRDAWAKFLAQKGWDYQPLMEALKKYNEKHQNEEMEHLMGLFVAIQDAAFAKLDELKNAPVL
jgi:hypothetical protein